ncbi:hypothetical protein ABFV05_009652 [Capra hircus]
MWRLQIARQLRPGAAGKHASRRHAGQEPPRGAPSAHRGRLAGAEPPAQCAPGLWRSPIAARLHDGQHQGSPVLHESKQGWVLVASSPGLFSHKGEWEVTLGAQSVVGAQGPPASRSEASFPLLRKAHQRSLVDFGEEQPPASRKSDGAQKAPPCYPTLPKWGRCPRAVFAVRIHRSSGFAGEGSTPSSSSSDPHFLLPPPRPSPTPSLSPPPLPRQAPAGPAPSPPPTPAPLPRTPSFPHFLPPPPPPNPDLPFSNFLASSPPFLLSPPASSFLHLLPPHLLSHPSSQISAPRPPRAAGSSRVSAVAHTLGLSVVPGSESGIRLGKAGWPRQLPGTGL